ncbi:hypothetical protein GPL15_20710 [Clostridium sp. MCC353]|uniref:plasmid pRiA4b ORF-3 family protein n=1 Tax=Clostridium sp. MCC353 TaxID=2592646 RepID=UPI00207AFA93|nr:plasmid pRiA4b ORF-3 family protein [Clostridium sp. MCC353]MBT9778901.1 hypothetical protein [Clostridium sp. MCC353]
MPYLYYQLKVAPVYNNQVYRVIEIDGNRTFADLSDAILNAFKFDHSHLYMFSKSRKPYDPKGYYHPMSDRNISADKVRLRDEKLVVRNKYLYLYDFGDEWMFYITVTGIRETEKETPVSTIKSKGDLWQYPDWEEDECYDDDDEHFDDDEHSDYDDTDIYDADIDDTDDENDYDEPDALVITVVDESDDVVVERLLAIPALLHRMWIRLVEKDLPLTGDEEIILLRRLEEAGLVDVDETEEHLNLKVRCGKENWKEYGIHANLQKRCAFENTLLSLAGIYGVIERELFYGVSCDDIMIPTCS